MNDARLWHPWLRINRLISSESQCRFCATGRRAVSHDERGSEHGVRWQREHDEQHQEPRGEHSDRRHRNLLDPLETADQPLQRSRKNNMNSDCGVSNMSPIGVNMKRFAADSQPSKKRGGTMSSRFAVVLRDLLLRDLVAFLNEYRRCGDLAGDVEGYLVTMSCSCGARIARRVKRSEK